MFNRCLLFIASLVLLAVVIVSSVVKNNLSTLGIGPDGPVTTTRVLPPPPPPPQRFVTYADGKFRGLDFLGQCIEKSQGQLLVMPTTEEETLSHEDVMFSRKGDRLVANFRHLHKPDKQGYVGNSLCPNGCWDIMSQYEVNSNGTFADSRPLKEHKFDIRGKDDFLDAANRALRMKSCRPPVFGPDAA